MKDIVAVISSRVKLERQGKNYIGICPLHQEKTPSFIVNPSEGLYECFGCGCNGDVEDFIEIYNLSHDGIGVISDEELSMFPEAN
ncbi:CHC2 zinc finger domain-containing protein [Pluralibacter gergoviae]|uniref:CHC2 zinc finger domain-containing protein n=1 Tax=Pluralibacter gergoviae TaxID=61647 RepID=UPI00092E90A7|nr:CHC2 zinc finger domain-containing protein [Pluralibacter gergoviae]